MLSLLPVAGLILKGLHSPHPVFMVTYFISGRERQRQRETKSWEQWLALRSPLAIINPMIDVSFSTFPTLHREEQRKCYLTFYYWCKVTMAKTRKSSPPLSFIASLGSTFQSIDLLKALIPISIKRLFLSGSPGGLFQTNFRDLPLKFLDQLAWDDSKNLY